MPTYRIYYAEREVKGHRLDEGPLLTSQHLELPQREYVGETEWEERVEAANPADALEAFFGDHVSSRDELRWVDDYHETHEVRGLDLDPEKTYLWIENGKLMEYQGMDEALHGRVPCPLCNGEGDVDEEQAAEYESLFEDEEAAIDADIRG